jgi:argininosuccinate synthase
MSARGTVVLAYSGGLDTSAAVAWLAEEAKADVVALAVDVGQSDFDGPALMDKARRAGAVDAVVVDARAEMAEQFVAPAIMANGLYEGRYPLVSALSRPLIARHLVAVAREIGAFGVAHGCTGKGNDQVRFEVGTQSLAPELEVLAPVRDWGMNRAETMAYAAARGIPVPTTLKSPYSIDENLWGRAIECGEIEDPWAAPPEEPFTLTRLTDATPTEVVVGFERGIPVTLDGQAMPLAELIVALNQITGARGFGRLDMVENRRVGIKSREVYECPGALALLIAHRDLESITLERDLAHEKARLEPRWAELVYDGLWFSPLKAALDAFVASSQELVTGEVRLFVGPGVCQPTGRRSPTSLYDEGLATYESGDTFDQGLAEGFVRLWGLSVRTWARYGAGGQG